MIEDIEQIIMIVLPFIVIGVGGYIGIRSGWREVGNCHKRKAVKVK